MGAREEAVYRFDAFRLNLTRGTLYGPNGEELPLRPKVFALLLYLLEHPGHLLEREELLDAIWPDVTVTDDSLSRGISDLRSVFGDRALHILKTLPRRGYILVAEVRREQPVPARPARPAVPPHDQTSMRQDAVTIQEFVSPDGQSDEAHLARALTTDLIAALSRFEDLSISSGEDDELREGYHVRGEVRAAAGDRWRVTVTLKAGGKTVWADRHDWPKEENLEPPETLLHDLSAHLDHQIDRESLRQASRKPPPARTARDFCLLGKEHHQRGTEADTLLAREMFDQAIAADPDYGQAYAWQAYVVQRAITHGWGTPGGQEARDLSLKLARRAVQLAPESPLCHSRLAFALLLHQRWDEAVETARAALRLGRPAYAATRATCAEVLAHGGYADEAVGVMRRAMSTDPFCPPVARAVLGRALLLAGEAEAALPELRWCAARLPDYGPCYHSLVVAFVETGRLAEARNALQEVLRLRPEWVPRNDMCTWFFRDGADFERFRKAFGIARLANLGVPGVTVLDPTARRRAASR